MSISNQEQIAMCMAELKTAATDTANCLNILLQEIESNEFVPFEVKAMANKLNESRASQLSVIERLQALQAGM